MPRPEPEKAEPQIDADGHGLILKAETEAVIGCAFEVLNELGHGLLEKPYENALVVEFGLRAIQCEQQRRYDVLYKTVIVGEYVPDLIAFGIVVVDAKVIERITDHELGQMLNYLKITGHPVGLILNFRRARLEWKRVVDTSRGKSYHG
jgi:GxxExxY protein